MYRTVEPVHDLNNQVCLPRGSKAAPATSIGISFNFKHTFILQLVVLKCKRLKWILQDNDVDILERISFGQSFDAQKFRIKI